MNKKKSYYKFKKTVNSAVNSGTNKKEFVMFNTIIAITKEVFGKSDPGRKVIKKEEESR